MMMTHVTLNLTLTLTLTLAPPRCSALCQPPKDDLTRDQERWYHDPTPLQWEFQSVCARHLFSGAPSARGGANMPISHTMLWYFIENRFASRMIIIFDCSWRPGGCPCLKCPLPGLTGNQERSRSERVYCVPRLLSLSVLPVHSTAPRTVGSHCVDNAPRPAALRTHPHLEHITGDTEFYFITLITLTCVVFCSHIFDLYIVFCLFLLLSCTFDYDDAFYM